MNPQATKKKVIVALVLVVIYILSAAFDFHPTIVAPIVVVLIALTFFFPSILNPVAARKDTEISTPSEKPEGTHGQTSTNPSSQIES